MEINIQMESGGKYWIGGDVRVWARNGKLEWNVDVKKEIEWMMR